MTLADRLRGTDVAERLKAMQELVARAAAPTPAELGALRHCLGDHRKEVQRPAAETFASLAARAPEAMAGLREALEAEDWRLRWGAAFALSLAGPLPVSAISALMDALAADDGDIRWAAAERLKDVAVREPGAALPELLRLAESGSVQQQKMILYCLRDLEVGAGVEVAERGLQSSSAGVRLAALSALARLSPSPATAERIVVLLKDDDERVQRAAAAVLGSIGVALPTVLSALDEASQSPDPSLRRAAERSLRRLRDIPT